MQYDEAHRELMQCAGVGPKAADCILLFAFQKYEAFPVDVWILRALRTLYFSGAKTDAQQLRAFIESHFGPHAGYAQQYLFHHLRLQAGRVRESQPKLASQRPPPRARKRRGPTSIL